MKKKSLMKSIILSSICTLVIALLAVSVPFSTTVNVRYFDVLMQDFYHTVAAKSNEMSSWITKHKTITENLAASAVVADLHGDELQTYLKEAVLPVSDSILDCYVAWEEEAPLMIAGLYPCDDDYVPQDRDWYKRAVSEGKVIITEPYIDATTGNVVITMACPVKKNGATAGCCGIDIEVTELIGLTDNLKVDENGYAILVDADNNVVVHTKDSSFNHQLNGADEKITALAAISPLYEKILASASTGEIIQDTDYDGTKRFFPIVPLGDSGWKIIYAADYNEAFSQVSSHITTLVVLGVLGMIIGALFLNFKFSRRLKPLAKIETIVSEMAHGKLDHDYPTVVNDDVGVLCHELRETNIALKSYINEIGRSLSLMASGDFTDAKDISFVGEFVAIGDSLKSIQAALVGTFSQISSATVQISGGSTGVASGATELAGAVSEQTALINDVVSSIESIAKDVAEAADNAGSAKLETIRTADIVKESNEKMDELLKAMLDIATSAEKIVRINTTIEDIAFQTNILALNASVEAARAGEAGKGFAVVADEVRNLASKSAEASNTTNSLISETVSVIEEGKKLANETAGLLSTVVERAAGIEKSITEISDVTENQKFQLTGIVSKLGEVSGVVHTTAATAEESAAASEELDKQVEMLNDSLRKYKI